MPAPTPSQTAVVLCCDAAYLPYTAFLAHQVAATTSGVDIRMCSDEALDLPPSLIHPAIAVERLPQDQGYERMQAVNLPRSTYLRVFAAEALGPRYGRLLYLDSDIFVDAPDLSPLLGLDLGGRTIGAVRDIRQWRKPWHQMPEFATLGLGALPYFNAGVLLVDGSRYTTADVLVRALETAASRPDALPQNDQSLLNILFRDDWSELHPAWNWQWAGARPLFGTWADVRLAHFGGSRKPWKDALGLCPPRYRLAYQAFFDTHFPDLDLISPPGPTYLRRRAGFVEMAAKYIADAPAMERYLGRFAGIESVLAP